MAFQIRRGLLSDLNTFNAAEGEILYTTDSKQLFVGDQSGHATLVSSAVVSVNGYNGVVALRTTDISEATGALYFTNERAQDAVGLALTSGNSYNSGITFTYDDANNRITATVSAQGTIDVGTLNSLSYYSTNGRQISPTQYLSYNNVGGVLSVDDGVLQHVSNFGNKSVVRLQSFHGNVSPTSISFQRARGTSTAPSAVRNGDALNEIVFTGYDGYSYVRSGSIQSVVSDVVSQGVVPNTLLFETTGLDGVSDYRLRISQEGIVTIGPVLPADTGTGQIIIRQTISGSTVPIINARNTFNDNNGANIGLYKQRGTQLAPTAAVQNDYLGDIKSYAFDGTAFRISTIIRTSLDAPITAGHAPGAISFGMVNAAGTLIFPTKISAASGISTLAHTGTIAVTGRISSTGYIQCGTYTNSTARDAAITAPAAGMIVIVGGIFQGYNGTAWVNLS